MKELWQCCWKFSSNPTNSLWTLSFKIRKQNTTKTCRDPRLFRDLQIFSLTLSQLNYLGSSTKTAKSALKLPPVNCFHQWHGTIEYLGFFCNLKDQDAASVHKQTVRGTLKNPHCLKRVGGVVPGVLVYLISDVIMSFSFLYGLGVGWDQPIHLIPKWLPFNFSFVFIQISSCLNSKEYFTLNLNKKQE